MHQTTYGETHKVRIYEADKVRDFLEKISILIEDKSLENCIYENKKVIQSKALNFLNLQDPSHLENQLKYLIRNAYDESEKIFPFSGDVFIENFLNSNLSKEYKTFKFSKKYESRFLETIKDETVRKIGEWLFGNISLERIITVESTHLEEVCIESNDDLIFNLKYDSSFLSGKFYHEMKNYKVVIIDGFIETVGEIHHLLHNAAKSKTPHAIFCFGMSEEVKHTIMTNNSKGITEIFPVVMQLDSETANILNDFAILHNAEVISALKGQTISQAVRNNLHEGSKIVFFKDKLIIDPVCSNMDMIKHRKFLLSRINNAPPDTDIAPIKQRLKNFNVKSTKVYIPKNLYSNILFLRELDYLLTFLNSMKYEFVEHGGRFFPYFVMESIQKKINSLENTYHNIDKAVILSR